VSKILPFEKEDVKTYLDDCIKYWRLRESKGITIAQYYIDAYQSVRVSLFGERLPFE